MASFKKGDVVRLKSGGPRMTVTDTEGFGDNQVKCTWFDKSLRMQDVFDVETIEIGDGGVHVATMERG